MKFNKDTVSRIAKNAKAAQEIWQNFAHDKKLCECFHLRPTASGITLISMLYYAPMRGISVNPDKLKDVLEEIAGKTNVLLGLDANKSLELMKKWGFKSKNTQRQ